MKVIEQIVKRTYADNGYWLPPSEVQPLVRCKDCKYVECEGIEGFLVCDLSGFSHLPEFFCADGERK